MRILKKGLVSKRIIEIDDSNRSNHTSLTKDDVCYCLGEYLTGKGYEGGEINQLIINFKKELSYKGTKSWKYKARAINEVASFYKKVIRPKAFKKCTLIPIPPSKTRGHPEYDDRVLQLIQKTCTGVTADIRELIILNEDREAFHKQKNESKKNRPKVYEFMKLFTIDETLTEPAPKEIILFDDVITTGTHFKACKNILQARFPKVDVKGLFIARRKPEEDKEIEEIDWDEFFS